MGVTIIVGIIFGALWSLVVNVVSKRKSAVLWGINIVLGALGAVAANQLLVWGPFVLGLSIIPTIVGAVVLAMVGTYGYIKVRDHYAQ